MDKRRSRDALVLWLCSPRKPYSAEAKALFARMSVEPAATRKGQIDTLIRRLKIAGLWTKFDILYLLAAHDAQAARLNWIADAHNLTAVSSPTFTEDRGYAGNGSTSYLDTGWAPSTGPNFTLNSASLGVYVNAGTDDGAATRVAAGCISSGAGAIVIPRSQTTNKLRGRINASASVDSTGSAATILGLSCLTRTDASNVNLYRNGALDSTVSSASASMPAIALAILANNNAGVIANFSDARVAFAFAGAGLSAADIAAINTLVLAYLTPIGAN